MIADLELSGVRGFLRFYQLSDKETGQFGNQNDRPSGPSRLNSSDGIR